MTRDHTQEAFDEYYTTGIDPTGGAIGPDFDPETGLELEDDDETVEEVVPDIIVPERDIEFQYNVEDDGHIYLPSRILFFDTETDGLPSDYRFSAHWAPQNWPHIVQLAWLVMDDEGNELSSGNTIIRPEGFVISPEATAIHGISHQRALAEGEALHKVLKKFRRVLEGTYLNVAHNLWFDANVVAADMSRCGMDDDILYWPGYCTMEGTTDLCKLPFATEVHPDAEYKWPKLSELHDFLFGCGFQGAHDAMNDVRATAKCFWELYRRKLI
ncbi:MAG: 3'-5' exonuclease [Bacteroidales bacterium]|nr:3'-5' exonuclease [Bacteroidales bacterium]